MKRNSTRICRTCGEGFPNEDYRPNIGNQCRPCRNSKSGSWRKANPDYQRKYRESHRGERARKNRENPYCAREYRLKKEWGMSLQEYERRLLNQGGRCAICKGVSRNRALAIDHNHLTGEIRGLLCQNCNIALGLFKDSPEMIQEALCYLMFYRNREVVDGKSGN